MIKQTLNLNEFISLFYDENGELKRWSYEGLKALYGYLCDLEDDIGKEIEADVIAINSEYTEFKNIEDYLNNYSSKISKEDYDTEEEYKKALEEEIRNQTELIKISEDLDDGFIIRVY